MYSISASKHQLFTLPFQMFNLFGAKLIDVKANSSAQCATRHVVLGGSEDWPTLQRQCKDSNKHFLD
jgi:hypothetical protein